MEEVKKQRKGRKILNILLVFIITFIVNIIWTAIITIAYSVSFAIKGGNTTDPTAMMDFMTNNPVFFMLCSVYNLIAIAIVYLFWRFVDKRNTAELGFKWTKKIGVQLAAGIAGAVAAILLIVIFGMIFGIISFESSGFAVYSTSSILGVLLIGIITFLLVGFGEESVFRSYIQNHMVHVMGKPWGLILAAAIFTAAHLLTYGEILDFIDVFLAGIILGYAFILTKSIYLPAAFHFMWDYLQLSIFRLQDYPYYKGPVLMLFHNTGDLVIKGFHLGNKLEVVFILVEVLLLSLMYVNRNRIASLNDEMR